MRNIFHRGGPHRSAVLLLALAALPGASALAQTPAHQAASLSAETLAGRIDAHYNRLRSLEVHFVQTYEGMGMNRKEEGALLLKKPGRMRWTYSQPDGKLFVLDGKDGYFYSPGQNEAQKVPAKDLDDMRSPLSLLLGHTQLMKQLTGISLKTNADGTYTLAGVPRGLEKRVASFAVTANEDGTIRALRVEETDGIVNQFRFSGEAANVPVKDTDFAFEPPPGVHIVTGLPPV